MDSVWEVPSISTGLTRMNFYILRKDGGRRKKDIGIAVGGGSMLEA